MLIAHSLITGIENKKIRLSFTEIFFLSFVRIDGSDEHRASKAVLSKVAQS